MTGQTTNLVLRNDTILGVCEAIGQDFGFNPNWLRLAFCLPIYWNPALVISAYLGLGLLVAGVLAAEPVVARAGAVALAVSALGVVASVAVAALRPWTAPPGPRRVPLPVLRS